MIFTNMNSLLQKLSTRKIGINIQLQVVVENITDFLSKNDVVFSLIIVLEFCHFFQFSLMTLNIVVLHISLTTETI